MLNHKHSNASYKTAEMSEVVGYCSKLMLPECPLLVNNNLNHTLHRPYD